MHHEFSKLYAQDDANLLLRYNEKQRNLAQILERSGAQKAYDDHHKRWLSDRSRLNSLLPRSALQGGASLLAGGALGALAGKQVGHPFVGAWLGAPMGVIAGSSLEEAIRRHNFKKKFQKEPVKGPDAKSYLERALEGHGS